MLQKIPVLFSPRSSYANGGCSLTRSGLRFAFAVALVCLFAVPLSAQTFRGSILGTVTDPNGAVVPEATVTAKNVGTGIERTTTTDSFGNYTLSELQTGIYEVTVQKSGFKTATVTGVSVEVSAERRRSEERRVGKECRL